ncbi:ATP-binding cassette domain-containing protein [bacterium]|nr:ATP-binding cassette domain-containing protein [bacterium]
MALVNINQLKVRQGAFELSIPELRIEAGQILGVMGKSGAGKTTFLHALMGFLPILSGEIEVKGQSVGNLSTEKRGIALMFQKPWLFEHQTVIENVGFGLAIQGISKEARLTQARDWLKKMQIADLEDRKAWEVSGGQAQRVALARAMAVGFPLLLLDEPFSAVEAPLRKDLRKLVRDLIQESQKAAIVVSHDWRDLEELAAHILVLDRGEIIANETPQNLKTHPDLQIRSICES